MIEKMSLREKIGQMIMTGLPGTSADSEFRRLVKDNKIGNIILFTRNVKDKNQVKDLCTDLQKLVRENTGIPAFITVDQEGGMVSRMPDDCTNIPGAMAMAATQNPQNARLSGRITGLELDSMGINVDIAPVLDINSKPHNPVIGVRSYGDTKEIVSEFGIQMMEGLLEGGVMPVIKHFPGHGDTAVDSHLGLPVINKTVEELQQNELVPFKMAIDAGAPCVMSSHIMFPAIEKDKVPGTMSRSVITGLLKEKLGFKGLVMSDCLEMNAIRNYYGTAQGAVAAVKAGIHIVSVSHTPELVEASVKAIEAAVLSGEIPVDFIDRAVEKILEYKNRYIHEPNSDISEVGCQSHREAVKQIGEASMTLCSSRNGTIPPIGGSVLFVGCPGNRATLASNDIKGFNFPEYMAAKMGGSALLCTVDPTPGEIEDILSKTEGYDNIIIGTYNGHLNQGQITLANRLCALNSNVIAVALRNPYDAGLIKGSSASLATYEYTRLAFDSLIRVFKGEIAPNGVLPVKIIPVGEQML